MARFNYQQNSFTAGKLSRKLATRSDIQEYRQGCYELENFLIEPTGGIRKRPGLTTAFNAFSQGFNIPFVYNDQAAIVSIGAASLGNQVRLASPTSTIYTMDPQGDASDALSAAYNLSGRDRYGFTYTQYESYLIICHVSGTMPPVVIEPSFYSPPILGGNFITTFGYLDGDSGRLKKSPWLVNPILCTPFDDANTNSSHTLVLNSGGTELTSSVAYFTSEMVGSRLLLDDKNSTARVCMVIIDSVTSSTVAEVTIEYESSSYGRTTATDYWYEASWSPYKGYPRCVTSFEGRLYFGGTPSSPTSLWASESGFPGFINRFVTFDPSSTTDRIRILRDPRASTLTNTLRESFPFTFDLSLGVNDQISWLGAGRYLFLGTRSRVVLLDPGDSSAISSLNLPRTVVMGYQGGKPQQVEFVRDSIIFIGTDERSIHQVKYYRDNGEYSLVNLTRLYDEFIAEDTISFPPVMRLSYNPDLNSLAILKPAFPFVSFLEFSDINDDIGFTVFNPNVDPSAVIITDVVTIPSHYTEISGQLHDRRKAATFFQHSTLIGSKLTESMSFIQEDKQTLSMDFIKLETIPGSEPYTITQVQPGITYRVIGLTSGESNLYPVVSPANTITLSSDYTAGETVVIGVDFKARYESLNLEVGPNFLYSSSGDIFRIDRATLYPFNSYDFNYGTVSDGEEILYPAETPQGLDGSFEQKIEVDLPMTSSRNTRVVIETDSLTQVHLLGITFRGNSEAIT